MAVVVGAAATALPHIHLQTEDRNGDGRPDVWKYYNARGRLIRVAIDTNFDGRSDVEETLVDGRLAERRSDRNFDGTIDRVDEFDVSNGELRRSTVDVNFDGRADLLLFFDGGRPVSTQWAADDAVTRPRQLSAFRSDTRIADEPLALFDNPFAAAARLRRYFARSDTLSSDGAESYVFVAAVAPIALPATSRVIGSAPARERASGSFSLGSRAPPPPVSL
jgi:hypothetical protein